MLNKYTLAPLRHTYVHILSHPTFTSSSSTSGNQLSPFIELPYHSQFLITTFPFLSLSSLASLIMAFAFLFSLAIILTAPSVINGGYRQPSPGFYPSSKFRSLSFNRCFRTLWGPSHQSLDNNALAIWLDSSSGQIHAPFSNDFTIISFISGSNFILINVLVITFT